MTAGVVEGVDIDRLRLERRGRLATAMERSRLETVLLMVPRNVEYATGRTASLADEGRARLETAVAVVTAGGSGDRVVELRPALAADDDATAATAVGLLAEQIGGRRAGRIAVDELTPALVTRAARALDGLSLIDAGPMLAEARACKTVDEVASIRSAQRITEVAMSQVREGLAPGVSDWELSGRFARQVWERGATPVVEPVWQTIPGRVDGSRLDDGGQASFPIAPRGRVVERGDVLWVDAAVAIGGYVSDYGRTWLVGGAPSPPQIEQHRRWRAVVDAVAAAVRPGATGADLLAAALAVETEPPWLRHLYLVHGLGQHSSEAPLIGTAGGAERERTLTLVEGMVLVIEPSIRDEGCGPGYRAEEVVVVTATGCESVGERVEEPFR